jgi:DNA-binding NtrC family response regulator
MERPTQIITYDQKKPVLTLRSAVVRVIAGPDEGVSRPLTLSRIRVGAAPDNDLVLRDSRVSRHHLEFQVHDKGYLVQDQDSTNGTFYRGARVGEVLVGTGAEIRLGSTVLRLEVGGEVSQEISGQPSFGSLIGASPAMQEIFGLLEAVAPTDLTVLIEGETGTGKEMVTEELHRKSPRRDRPLCIVDCGSLPPNLIESELFGHERGAFTGAQGEREGLFERARGGTVFLDEIGELPMELQTRLLRVLDRRTVKRVGGNMQRRVDFRLVAATNRVLDEEVREGRFRQDLYYRLAVVRLVMPPLRERIEDIPLLARHFLWQAGCADPEEVLKPDVVQALGNRSWPGNVRQLRNVIERAVIMLERSGGAIDLQALADSDSMQSFGHREAPPLVLPPSTAAVHDHDWLSSVLPPGYLSMPYKEAKDALNRQFEALYLARLVERHGQNISAMAKEAEVDRQIIRRLLEKHGRR